MRVAWVAVLAAVAAVPSYAHGTPIPRFVFVDGSERLAERIDCPDRESRPGFAIAVLHGDEVLLREDCGLADLERREPIGPETRFYVGQIGKTFTAAAVLRLYEKRQLGLDDPLARHFPELPAWAQRVRVMHLLNHTSGVPDPPDTPGPRSADRLDNARVMGFLRRQSELSFEPGSGFSPSDSAYVLLAELVERVTGTPFAEHLKREIFLPLGLEHTSVFDESEPEIPDRAVGYRGNKRGFVVDDYRGAATGAGGIFTTVDDLLRWHRALIEHRLLEPRTTAMMFDMPLTLTGRQSGMGMGWSDETVDSRRPRYEGLRAFGAIDTLGGFAASLTFYPDEELTIVLLANTGELPDFLADSYSEFLIRVPTRPRQRSTE